MQSPDQQPAEESIKPNEEGSAEPEFQQLYEFPPASSLLPEVPQSAPITKVLPEVDPAQAPSDEAVRQGLVYPPPPSFYQNMQVFSERPALPSQAALPYPGSGQPASGGFSHTQQAYMYRGSTQTYPPPLVPPMVQQPVKKSRTWIWVVVTIFSIAILASCGLCGWGFYSIFSTTAQQVSGSLNVVDHYYSNLQTQNFTAAYADLYPQDQITDLTQDQFTRQATNRDTQYGIILSYVPGQPAFGSNATTGPDLSRFTITVDVKRTHLNYTVLLTARKIGGSWKITYFDTI